MKVFVGADHRGFNLKEKIKNWLGEWKHEVDDEGAYEHDPEDDYTVFASKVARKVAENKNSLGVLSCGSGVGVDIVANKFDGVRASLGISPKQVQAGRQDDNMNILVIAADFTSEEKTKEMLKAFLESKYKKLKRYERRLRDIKKIEETN